MAMTSNVENKHKKTIGLALSGGGARGMAHIGVLKAMENLGITPDIIAGVSAGSIVATLYSGGLSPDEIIRVISKISLGELTELSVPRDGFFKLNKLKNFLKKVIPYSNLEDLPIPTLIEATDLDNCRTVTFDHGPIFDCVIASCSIPIIFKPVKINGTNYVDGGVLRNLPAGAIRNKCDFLIGVNVSPIPHAKYKSTIIDIASRTYDMMSKSNATKDIGLCDVVIQTDDIASYNVFNIKPMKEIIKSGYYEALKVFKENNITNNLI